MLRLLLYYFLPYLLKITPLFDTAFAAICARLRIIDFGHIYDRENSQLVWLMLLILLYLRCISGNGF